MNSTTASSATPSSSAASTRVAPVIAPPARELRCRWPAGRRARPPGRSGTSSSRGPAAMKSGTSKPAGRRIRLGMPSARSMPSSSSASAWLRVQATRTRAPWAYCGLILRARSWRSLSRASRPPGCTSGMPQRAQNRSLSPAPPRSSGRRARQPSQHAQDDLCGGVRLDPPRPHLGLDAGQTDDDVDRARPQRPHAGAVGHVDVGLGGIGHRARVRV